jgi:hypothetical protein
MKYITKKNLKKYGSKVIPAVQRYAKEQGEHMRANKDYWDVSNMYSMSSVPGSSSPTRRRVIKKRIIRARPRRRYAPAPYYPQQYYRPIYRHTRRAVVKKVKHHKTSSPRQQDPFSMF